MSGRCQFKHKRATPFSIRFSDDQRARVEARAGAMPVGAYTKLLVLSEDAPHYRKRRAMPEAEQRLLAEILARLGASRSASNLNQIAKHLNQGTLVIDAELEDDLKRACAEVAWLRTTRMQALGIKDRENECGKP